MQSHISILKSHNLVSPGVILLNSFGGEEIISGVAIVQSSRLLWLSSADQIKYLKKSVLRLHPFSLYLVVF